MPDAPKITLEDSNPAPSAQFSIDFGLSLLTAWQGVDGSWGFRPGSRGAVEPTAWALLALQNQSKDSAHEAAIDRGVRWLLRAQLRDGSWPAISGQTQGCWVTSLAGLALATTKDAREATRRGLRWLCDAWPAESDLWWQVQRHLWMRKKLSTQNDAYHGWSWTLGTSSWVEPTAAALLLLRRIPAKFHPRNTPRRHLLGEAMLYDRMCPGGGWNSGNPVVYGVAGEPQVSTTAWALLALRAHQDRDENQQSLAWLEQNLEKAQGPGSHALAHICLKNYGRATRSSETVWGEFYGRNQFLFSVLAVCWASLALSDEQSWLEPVRW